MTAGRMRHNRLNCAHTHSRQSRTKMDAERRAQAHVIYHHRVKYRENKIFSISFELWQRCARRNACISNDDSECGVDFARSSDPAFSLVIIMTINEWAMGTVQVYRVNWSCIIMVLLKYDSWCDFIRREVLLSKNSRGDDNAFQTRSHSIVRYFQWIQLNLALFSCNFEQNACELF